VHCSTFVYQICLIYALYQSTTVAWFFGQFYWMCWTYASLFLSYSRIVNSPNVNYILKWLWGISSFYRSFVMQVSTFLRQAQDKLLNLTRAYVTLSGVELWAVILSVAKEVEVKTDRLWLVGTKPKVLVHALGLFRRVQQLLLLVTG